MPAREHVLLSDAERAALFGIPTDPDDLARRFTLEKPDLDLIGQRRRDRNRLGMALQFALIRHPGMTLAQVIQIEGGVPQALVVFVARQLSLDPAVFAVIAALRAANILVPMPSTIERAGIAGRARARKHAARMMVADLSPEQIGHIDALFDEQDGARLGWLKTIPVTTKADSVSNIVERLRVVRAIGIAHDAGTGVHPNRRHQFVQEGRLSPAYLIRRYTLPRRRAILAALLIDLEARLIDAALDIADKLIGGMFRRATNMQQRRYTASSREVAPYVLDGLLHHGSSLKIGEHYTDTGGATDHVFALCAMLGFRFCPRLRDFPDRRLAALGPAASYPAIGALIGKRVKADTIREHWGEVLRLVASLKAGHVAPSAMLRKLAAYERQNQVDLALQEIGRIERTFFMLDWLENPDLRRRCQAGLNKSEQRHVLTQAICTFRQGRIIDRTHETLQYRASGLNLVIAAIVYWNSTYIADAVQHLRSIGEAPDPALLAHSSPVGWEHIAFSGDFLWDRAAETVRRKPLNIADDRYAS